MQQPANETAKHSRVLVERKHHLITHAHHQAPLPCTHSTRVPAPHAPTAVPFPILPSGCPGHTTASARPRSGLHRVRPHHIVLLAPHHLGARELCHCRVPLGHAGSSLHVPVREPGQGLLAVLRLKQEASGTHEQAPGKAPANTGACEWGERRGEMGEVDDKGCAAPRGWRRAQQPACTYTHAHTHTRTHTRAHTHTQPTSQPPYAPRPTPCLPAGGPLQLPGCQMGRLC
jgi:hypothetical protein